MIFHGSDLLPIWIIGGESMKPKTKKSIRNSMRVLKSRSLITYDESKKPHVYKPTQLGKYVVKMFYNGQNE